MITRVIALMIAGSLCLSSAAAEARGKAKPRPATRVAALDLTKLLPPDTEERARSWRASRWTLGDARYDDGSDPNAIHWRLRGAGFKMKMPIAFSN